jgi:hypothetical protein
MRRRFWGLRLRGRGWILFSSPPPTLLWGLEKGVGELKSVAERGFAVERVGIEKELH